MENKKEANINVTLKGFFYNYIEFLEPFHKLRKKERQVLSLLLYYHYKLKKDIKNERILWKEVFDYDTRLLICDELGILNTGLENYLTVLRKKKVIVNNTIAPVYIPNVSSEFNKFNISINFHIKDEKTK